jgi:hypothetical protein
MAVRTVAANKAALAQARERREKLDEERRAQEQRQDVATAAALIALERLAEVEATRDGVLAEVGAAVRTLMDEDVSPERAAGLLGLDASDVRRLSKVTSVGTPAPATKDSGKAAPASASSSTGTATVTSLPDQSGSEDAARRAV